MAEQDSAPGTPSRRQLLRTGAIGAGIAGAAWVTPSVLTLDALGAASIPCTGRQGYFTWNRTAYTNGQRSGAPGNGNPMTNVNGWANHPTYTAPPGTTGGTTTGITIRYTMQNFTYLDTSGTTPLGHGVSTAGDSATFKSYRVSKIGTTGNGPPLDNVLDLLIEFSAPVGCPVFEIGDADNSLPTTGSGPGCTSPVSGSSPYWADGVAITGYTAAGGGGSTVATQRIAGAGGTNISPGVGSAGPFGALACQSVPQNSNASNLTVQALGTVRGLRLQYRSRFHDTVGNGAQHIALGNISFYY